MLTDGRIWKFYDPSAKGQSRNDRCACELDIGSDHEDQVEVVLLEMLSRSAVASGRAAQCIATALKVKRLDQDYEAKRERLVREYEVKHGSRMTFHRFAAPAKVQDADAPKLQSPKVGIAKAEGGKRRKGQRVKGAIELAGADGRTIKKIPFDGGASGWTDLVEWLAQAQGGDIMRQLQKELGSNRIADQQICSKTNGRPYRQQAQVAGMWVDKNLSWATAESLMRQAAEVAGYSIHIIEA